MTILKLEKRTWGDFCKKVTRDAVGKRVEMEIASREFGVHREARSLPLLGVVYDRKNDILEILLDGVDHLIIRPQEIYIGYGLQGVESFGIVDADSAWQIVVMHDPLMLPAPRIRARG